VGPGVGSGDDSWQYVTSIQGIAAEPLNLITISATPLTPIRIEARPPLPTFGMSNVLDWPFCLNTLMLPPSSESKTSTSLIIASSRLNLKVRTPPSSLSSGSVESPSSLAIRMMPRSLVARSKSPPVGFAESKAMGTALRRTSLFLATENL
jgi:hypothetical protein